MRNLQRHYCESFGGIRGPGQTEGSQTSQRWAGAAAGAAADAAAGLAAGGSAVVLIPGL